ncbi:MAG: amidohydrolase family protein, partial [Xanthobacteraceae bacterium]
MDATVPSPEALVTRGGCIAFIGDRRDAEEKAAKLPEVEVIDLRGRCVIPGLIDMHAHLDREGLKRRHPAMTGLSSRREVLERIEELASGMEDGEWLVTAPLGTPPFYFFDDPHVESDLYPTRWELDEVVP